MPKKESAQTLLKRLDKIERAQARLASITTRILAQADALADVLKLAQTFAGDDPPPPPASRSRANAAAKAPSARGRASRTVPATPASTAKRATAKRATVKRAGAKAASAKPAGARTRQPRRTASSS